MTQSDKNIAEFLRLGFQYSLVDINTIRRWGDALIEDRTDPSEWMIDIAFVESYDVDAHLKRVPGEAEPLEFVPYLCALLYHRWRMHEAPIRIVHSLGWELHLREWLTKDRHELTDWGCTLDIVVESFNEGCLSESSMFARIHQLLSRYEPLIQKLPEWITLN